MINNITVQCLVNRSWNIATRKWDGDIINGILIDISTQSLDNEPEKHIPVGIVISEAEDFHSIPIEFIKKI